MHGNVQKYSVERKSSIVTDAGTYRGDTGAVYQSIYLRRPREIYQTPEVYVYSKFNVWNLIHSLWTVIRSILVPKVSLCGGDSGGLYTVRFLSLN